MPFVAKTLEERLKNRLLIKGPDECWIDTKARNGRYGTMKPGGNCRSSIGTHRAAYKVWVGEIPQGMFICHTCDNPPCCNPAHLRAGTPKQNAQDRTNRGRTGIPRGPAHHLYKHGRYSNDKERARHTRFGPGNQ